MKGAWVLLGAAALALLIGLGNRDLWEPDEPRIGLVAEEMRSMRHGPGGLLLLHLNGEPYTQKPPLYYWLSALAGVPGGRVSEFAARLPSALAGIAVLALTLRFGSALLGARSALLGAGLLLTVHAFAELARRAQFDVLLALFELLALIGFWRLDRGVGAPRRNLTLLHGAMGLAILVKGPVAFLVPMLGFVMYLAWEKRLAALRSLLPFWGLLLSLGPALLWLGAAVSLAPVGFLDETVGTNLLGRFFQGTSHARPIYYYLYQLPVEFLPWTVLWPLVWWAARKRVFVPNADPDKRRVWRLLLAWVGAAFLFFSLSAGKRGLYMIPAFPPLALLCADAVVERFGAGRPLPGWLGMALAAAGLVLTAATFAAFAAPGVLGLQIPWHLPVAVGLVSLAGALAWRHQQRAEAPALARLGVVIAAVFLIEAIVAQQVLPLLEGSKSPRPIAEAAAAATRSDEPVGLFQSRSKLAGLAYYGDRKIVYMENAEQVSRFVSAGGRVVVVRADKTPGMEAAGPFAEEAGLRDGKRRWLVVSFGPRPAEGG